MKILNSKFSQIPRFLGQGFFLIATITFLFVVALNLGKGSVSKIGIYVDQFGYYPSADKVAVLSFPPSFETVDITPNSYVVRDLEDGTIVYHGTPTLWNNGAVHSQSGDRAAWFNFSSVNQPGEYVIEDVNTGLESKPFSIADDVYKNVLVTATRMFFYQRSGFPKSPPSADPRWVDKAAFIGPMQDTEARFVNDKKNGALARDMRGGWFDAGDTNKYVTFASKPVHELLDSYTYNPSLWTDAFNIPESGNNIPDLLDEVRYEIQWLKRMQDDDGGAFIKLGTIDYDAAPKPSLDKRPRYYAPKCSSSTIDISGVFAHSAIVFKDIPSLVKDVADLQYRAINAWQWYQVNPRSDRCDTQEIKAGDADRTIEKQEEDALTAAIYLAALTEEEDYFHYVSEHYFDTCRFCDDLWYPYHSKLGDALMFYLSLKQKDEYVAQDINNQIKQLITDSSDVYLDEDQLDPYRAYMPDIQYHWGSNAVKVRLGNANFDAASFTEDSEKKGTYRSKALDYIHYIHGVNPLGLVFLSNMYDFGAELSANEMYHEWLGQGIYSNALNSPSGPAPGYLTGGPNKDYTGSAPLHKRAPMKAYLDKNSGGNMKMWEITEPAIGYQSGYIKLLSRLMNS